MDGYEVARHLHARERSHHVPILFLTAIDASPDRVVEGYAVGAVDFLSKPFHPDVLRAKVSVFAEPDRRARLLLEAELREPGRVRESGAPLVDPGRRRRSGPAPGGGGGRKR
ncbi:MAG TPA: response regulator [Longimicrobiaceae bacterium]|nr:response regulator [Longimicrobiaceae bacterium]